MKQSQQVMGASCSQRYSCRSNIFDSGMNHLQLPWELLSDTGRQVLSELELLGAYAKKVNDGVRA